VRLGHVLLPVQDMDAALAFFTETLGLALRFRDGDRYAALDAGGGTLALLDPSEQPVPGEVGIGLRVDDLEGLARRLTAEGVEIVKQLAETEHERSFTFRTGDGTVFVAYTPTIR
jgi:catechol 2,3-dioxygenase-like lactoylglutathione lyase family enzyme